MPKKTGGTSKPALQGRKIWPLIRLTLNSIKVKYFYLDFDSGDYCLNAQATPLAMLLSGTNRRIAPNFSGTNILKTKIEYRIVNMLKVIWIYSFNK